MFATAHYKVTQQRISLDGDVISCVNRYNIFQTTKKGRRAPATPELPAEPVDDTVAEEVMAHETKSVSTVT